MEEKRLVGNVSIGGSKNATLPILTACLLTDEPMFIHNVPSVKDISFMNHLLMHHGTKITLADTNSDSMRHSLQFETKSIISHVTPYDIVRQMRASILVLGPILARHGRATVSLPGGCAIGARPINLHISALEQMGAKIDLKNGYICAEADNGLHGADITFEKISCTGTANIIMAAAIASGRTILRNVACEPEIHDLVCLLKKMGAKIEFLDQRVMQIDGVDKLHGVSHTIINDRIETGTYMLASAITGGDITLHEAPVSHINNIIEMVKETGTKIDIINDHSIRVYNKSHTIDPVDINTGEYPGFPTDMQAQFMSLMTVANGTSQIHETIFENRYMHVAELNRLGSNITVDGAYAEVVGVDQLSGCEVMATDLRASVSLVLAGLIAKGQTVIHRVYHLDRGYESLVDKLRYCGADIQRLIA